MFKIIPNPLFTADVPLTVPGQADPVQVKMVFKYKNKDQLVEFGKNLKKAPLEDSLMEIIESWPGVDAPFTIENVKILVSNYLQAGNEIIQAYHREVYESKVKN